MQKTTTTTPLSIRAGVFADYPIIKSYDEFIGDRRLDLQRGEIRVCDLGPDRAAGYMRISTDYFLAWPFVSFVCVKPDARRKGIARALLQHAQQDARFTRLYISTEEDNDAMRQLFQSLGATELGALDGINHDPVREVFYRLK